MIFNENLHFILESRGILIKELSAQTGISENTLKTYLRKDCADPTLSKAVAIARALNVNLEQLATGKDDAEAVSHSEMTALLHIIRELPESDLHILLATAQAMKDSHQQ